jgi:uncharacterized membrane protein YgcG
MIQMPLEIMPLSFDGRPVRECYGEFETYPQARNEMIAHLFDRAGTGAYDFYCAEAIAKVNIIDAPSYRVTDVASYALNRAAEAALQAQHPELMQNRKDKGYGWTSDIILSGDTQWMIRHLMPRLIERIKGRAGTPHIDITEDDICALTIQDAGTLREQHKAYWLRCQENQREEREMPSHRGSRLTEEDIYKGEHSHSRRRHLPGPAASSGQSSSRIRAAAPRPQSGSTGFERSVSTSLAVQTAAGLMDDGPSRSGDCSGSGSSSSSSSPSSSDFSGGGSSFGD